MAPVFFETEYKFRLWLEQHYDSEAELYVGFYKVGSGKPSMTWSQSVDQALCFGWIDGVRKTIDKESYCIRFTPRRKSSVWSAVNIQKIEQLTEAGLMTPAGLEIYNQRTDNKAHGYSQETRISVLDPDLEQIFRQEEEAWEFFTSQAPSYQKVMTHWIMSAKQEKTRLSRLEKTISESRQRRRMR